MIIHTVPAIADEASGPSYSVVRLCESVMAEGVKVMLAALDWAPMTLAKPFVITFPLGIGPRRLGRSPAMRRWLDEVSKSECVDVIHNHGMWQMNAVYPGWVAKRNNINLVVSPRGSFSEWAMQHGSFTKQIFWPLLQKPALSAAACFHATAHAEYEDIRRLGFRQPVAIIPNGVDIPSCQGKKSKQKRSLLFLGRIHPKKGLDMLLRAWQAVQVGFPDWSLRIVGSDDGYYGSSGYLVKMQRLSVELGLKHIEFSGALHGDEKWAAYSDADLFVLPTYSENFGMSVAEALAAGVPAIVTKGAPWAGLAEHGAGQWIDIGLDPLIAALEGLMQMSPAQLLQMGRQGRAWMMEDYSWNSIGKKMNVTYEWLRNGGACPSWVRID